MPLPTPAPPEIDAAAREALPYWGLVGAKIELISRSENTVYRVDGADGTTVALRVHRPGYCSRAELDSELAWVEALDITGIRVPQAIRNLDGEGYVEMGLPDGTSRQVGVVGWMDGSILADSEGDPTERYAQLGTIAAAIHNQATGWSEPTGFVRRRWDADGLMGPNPLWGRFWEAPELEKGHAELFGRARAAIHERLVDFGTAPERFSLIHADLHQNNVLLGPTGELTVFDFDDAGYGWHLHELGVALHSVLHSAHFDSCRDAFVAAYRRDRELTDIDLELLPMFLLIRRLMLVGWLNDRPEVRTPKKWNAMVSDAVTSTERYLG